MRADKGNRNIHGNEVKSGTKHEDNDDDDDPTRNTRENKAYHKPTNSWRGEVKHNQTIKHMRENTGKKTSQDTRRTEFQNKTGNYTN